MSPHLANRPTVRDLTALLHSSCTRNPTHKQPQAITKAYKRRKQVPCMGYKGSASKWGSQSYDFRSCVESDFRIQSTNVEPMCRALLSM